MTQLRGGVCANVLYFPNSPRTFLLY